MGAQCPKIESAVARVRAQAELGDAVPLIGDNRKVLVLKVEDIALMARGRAVMPLCKLLLPRSQLKPGGRHL